MTSANLGESLAVPPADPPADAYDLVPYENYTFPQTHPAWLAAVGSLFGLEPADPSRARVLELGCASGSNLIPIAALAPQSTCLGIELSRRQVDAGRADIAALGLKNIRIERQSITEITPALGQFDYVICHGVYSWVPPEVQKHILRVCKENLAPKGIAQVSYNTLPGWNAIKSLRDMMLYHSAQFADPAKRVTEAINLLQFVLNGLGDQDSAWRKTVEEGLKSLRNRPHAYIYHDHLEAENNPVYLHEFVAQASAQGLRYLGDAALNTMYLGNLPQPVADALQKLPDMLRQEQYMDFVCNRRFRQTLLVHSGIKPKFAVDREKIFDYHLTAVNLAPDFDLATDPLADDRPRAFGHGAIVAHKRQAAALFAVLHEQGEFPIAAGELIARAATRIGMADPAPVRAALAESCLKLIFAGRLKFRRGPFPGATEISARPEVWPLARHQAKTRPAVTTLRHAMATLDGTSRQLAQLLDGTRTIPEATAALWDRLKDRGLETKDASGKVVTDETLRRRALEARVAAVVAWFRDQGLFSA